MQIGRKDVMWNFAGTFMRVASGLIVLPLVLRLLPVDEVGLWSLFLTVGGIAALLDFGFSNTFSRNITYVFSGAKELKSSGFISIDDTQRTIDYSLLKSLIAAMRRYYAILAIFFLIIYIAVTPFYIPYILDKNNYQGNYYMVYVDWLIYGALIAYQLYTYYYSSLLNGRGYVKKNQQIIILGQISRILIAVILLLLGYGLTALVIGQLIADIVNRFLCYKAFFDNDVVEKMSCEAKYSIKYTMSIMTPNALKVGLTIIRGFLINYATMFLASLYLPLNTIAELGISKQFIDLIAGLGMLWYYTYYPKISFYRLNEQFVLLKRSYVKANLLLILIFIICGIGMILIAPFLLSIIGAKTHLLSSHLIFIFLIITLLELNSGMATSFLVTKNEVPFYKSNIISGIASFLFVFVFFHYLNLGVLSIFLGQGISQALYMNWKWPYVVIKELNITLKDYFFALKNCIHENGALLCNLLRN